MSTVASNAADMTVALTGTGTQTELSRDPATLAFGARDVDEGPRADRTATITNSGSEPVTLTGLTLGGEDSPKFERLADQAGDCTASTVLTAGQTCAVRVRFDPTSNGAETARLTIASNAADVMVALTGTAAQVDADGDGTRDSVDTDADDDGDGTPDAQDTFPLNPDESVDTDGDGVGNNRDGDDDGDGVPDGQDAFPLDSGRQSQPRPPAPSRRPAAAPRWTLDLGPNAPKVSRRRGAQGNAQDYRTGTPPLSNGDTRSPVPRLGGATPEHSSAALQRLQKS